MEKGILVVLVIVFLVLGICVGYYFGYHIVKSQHIVKWNWYQPSSGPDMGRWKQGPSGDVLAALIYLFFVAMGSALGVGIGLGASYLVNEYIYPLISEMRIASQVLTIIPFLMGTCYGFYLGRLIVKSLMIVHWMAYYMGDWGAWRYQSSWGPIPISITIAIMIIGSALGLIVGLCIGYLFEKCVCCLTAKR